MHIVARKDPPQVVQPALPVERAITAFKKQLGALQQLKGRNFDEARASENEWEHLTQSLVERQFGNPSSNLSKFHRARSAGHHNIGGISPQQRQQNFESRIQEHESLLRSLILELEWDLPVQDIQGAYEVGDEYAFYRDLSNIIQSGLATVFIVDAYVDEKLFNLFVDKVAAGVHVRILSNNLGANVPTVADMFSKSRPLELRTSKGFHDRMLFVDGRGWVFGQSIKDAAAKKPTFLVELQEPVLSDSRASHEHIWAAATPIV